MLPSLNGEETLHRRRSKWEMMKNTAKRKHRDRQTGWLADTAAAQSRCSWLMMRPADADAGGGGGGSCGSSCGGGDAAGGHSIDSHCEENLQTLLLLCCRWYCC